MRIWKIVIITSLLLAVVIYSFGCGSKSGSTLPENQVATIQRGNLIVDITAVGNLALSFKVDLAFEMPGTVEEVLVKEADSVEEEQVLVRLDTSEWEDNLATLESQVRAKEHSLPQAEANVRAAETALAKAQDVYHWPDIDIAQAAVDTARANLQYAIDGYAKATSGTETSWQSLVKREATTLKAAETKLNAMLTGADPEQVATKELQLDQAEWQLEDAQEALEDAQKALDEAKELSPEVTAPFTGFITKVNVKGGDEVKKGTVAVTLADPNKFEADILVNETDILQVKLGGEASVQVDAMSGLSLPAKVTHISPTAIIQQGVVNYKVKIEVQSLKEALQEQQEAMQKAMQERQQATGNISSGAPFGGFRQPFAGDNLTQEQINQMIQQRQQGLGEWQGQAPAILPENFQLKEGLTVTVSIIIQERNDVLLVPNAAIISRGTETLVQVLKDGVTEERSIRTGISDWQYTEVTNGLSEGEKVIVPQGTTTTPTTSTRGGQMPFFPGGMRR